MIRTLEQACAALQEPVQALSTAIALRKPEGRQLRVLLASPRHGAGTTLLASATAAALCRSLGARVALIEANVFRPALATYAGGQAAPGFADCLETGERETRLQPGFVAGLEYLPAGKLRADLAPNWRGAGIRRLLEVDLAPFSFVLVDAPPLLDHPVGRLLLSSCDASVLIVRAGSTTHDEARTATAALRESGIPTLGAALNRTRRSLL